MNLRLSLQSIGISAVLAAAACSKPSGPNPSPKSDVGETVAAKTDPAPEPEAGKKTPRDLKAPLGTPTNPAPLVPPGSKVPKDAIPKMPEPNPKAFQIPKTGTGNWTKATISPTQLATRIDKAIREMSGIFGGILSTIKTPMENGQVRNEIKVQDYKTFSVQTVELKGMPAIFELRADGSRKAMTDGNGRFLRPRPLASGSREATWTPKQLVQQWPEAFPRLAFLGLTEGKDSWSPYLKELVSGRSGFKGEISERRMTLQGQNYLNYRIVARRTPEAAKRLGSCEIEMVFDGKRFLPVTVKMNRTEPGGGTWKVNWAAGWSFDKKFDPKEFAIPSPG